MLPIITCLTLLSVIYIVHVQADEQDDPIDSNIFSSSEKQELKIFQGHQRWLHKKALRQLKEKEATSFFSYFCCAVDHCRGVMELNHKFTELYLNLYHTRVTPQDLPEDFQHLNDTCDEWLDVVFYRKNPKNKKPPRQKIKSAYLVWYTALSSEPDDNAHSYFLNLIRTKLQKIRIIKPIKYETNDVIYRRFSASMARSYRIFASLYHDLITEMSNIGRKNPKLPFNEVLFELIPKWSMTAEDIAFQNVLIDAHHNRPVNANKTLIETIFFERGTDDWVCVPAENSEYCIVIRNETPPAHYLF